MSPLSPHHALPWSLRRVSPPSPLLCIRGCCVLCTLPCGTVQWGWVPCGPGLPGLCQGISHPSVSCHPPSARSRRALAGMFPHLPRRLGAAVFHAFSLCYDGLQLRPEDDCSIGLFSSYSGSGFPCPRLPGEGPFPCAPFLVGSGDISRRDSEGSPRPSAPVS